MRIIREDWLVVAKDEDTFLRLAFGDGPSDYQAPQWPDPERPQQLHVDITVHDLDAVEALVLGLGATRLQDKGEYRSYADPVGHPFCLYRDTSEGSDRRLNRVVFDCFSPRALAEFYEELLGMHVRKKDSQDFVVIAKSDGSFPVLAFQRTPKFVAPRWPDPAYPQQIHLDLYVQDGEAAQAFAERLGAVRMPDIGGSCPVYADPSAHPFCLCAPGQ